MSHREYATVLLCFLTVFILSIGSLPAAAQTSGLVAAYGFNETSGSTAADSSGNNNTGTLGSGVTRTTAGRFGSALVFNGSSFVTIPDAASLDLTTGMTLEAWVFPTTKAGNLNTAIMKEQPGQLVYALYTAGNPANRPNVYFNVSADSSGERGIAGPSALQLNTWSHLAATYNGSTLSLYVNGALVASQAFSGSIITSTGPLRIGGNGVSGQYFIGRIDEVRIYNRALSQTEIQSDMNTAVGGTTPPDTTGPSAVINSPTNGQTVTTSSITVSGTATDSGLGNNGISSVMVNGVAASGGTATGSGTANWSRSVTLNPGANTITVVAKDASTAQNSTTVSITVNYNAADSTGPAVAITSHTNNQAVTTSPITVSGTASDSGLGNNGISSVTVNGVAASGGTATGSGTANWSRSVTLNPGANTITVVAKDASAAQNSTTVSITVNYNAADTTGPAVAITSHTNNQTVTTSPITVSGTATDSGLGNNGISSVTVNGVAASGGTATGSGTANWSRSVTLNPGANTITVVAKDASAAQNSTTVSITVNYNAADTTGPAVAITSHTNNQTVTASPITVSGTATDSGLGNNGISSVTVNGVVATGGTATGSGTANWSQSVALNPGANTITVVAKDASTAQNSTTVSITVNYNAADSTGPAVAITSHTNNQTVSTSPITVSGTATDSGLGNNGISSVMVNGVAASGGTATGSGTANWSQSVTLNPGANTITVVAKDNSTAQNSTTVSITVNYNAADSTGPAVAITSHTNNQTVSTSPITVSGTATDSGLGNNGISSVMVNGVAASGGTATGSGTANWSQSVTLNPGANTITVVAKDNSTAQNSTTVSITVNYNAADSTGPAVAITSHTSNQAVTTSPITVSGTASDSGLGNNGISSVTVNGVAATGGTATGSATANWNRSVTLNPGANTITVVAKDNSTNQNSTTVSITVNYNAADSTGPAAAITSHTNNQVVSTSPITLSGTASDSGLGNSGISSVMVNGVAASGGTATGSATANWSQSVTLNPGANTITVVAKDNSTNQNSTTVQITVTYDPTPPTVAITTPTSGATYTASSSPLTLGGTASDDVGVTQVAWSNSLGGSGTATGTTSWTASVVLQSGTNVLTVTAHDAANNTGTATLTVTYTPPSGLMGAYSFNEGNGTTSADVSGNAHPTSLIGGTTWVAGHTGSAVSFNGVSAYGTVAAFPYLPNWTVSVWVRSPAAPSGNSYAGPVHRETNFQLNWDHGDPSFRGAVAVKVAGSWYSTSFGALAANTWYFLAATYDGETLNAYTNGVLVSSNAAPSGPAASDPNQLTFGKHAAAGYFFQGIVDDVRLYNRALTQAEIQTDMNTPVGGTPPPPDTTPPTVALTSPASGATVSGTVTVAANASDNVGVVGVQFVDGATLIADVTASPYSTSWNSTGVTNGSHVLSAVARDAAGNQTSSSINVTVSNSNPTDPSNVGQWSAPFSLPVKAVHMTLFRTGEVLMWDAFGLGQEAYLWNSSTGTLTYVPSVDNIFCSAPALMADGNALIAGGHSAAGVGIPDVNRFNPVTKTWSPLAPMAFPRWYPTATTLSDGRVLVVGGSTTCFTCIGDIPEVYNPTTNTWTQLGAARLSMPLYPHTFVLPDGRILYASSTEGVIQTQTLDLGTQTWTMIDPNAVPGGSSAMYRPGVILKSGTPGAPSRIPVAPSSATAYVLDMNQPSPVWQPVGSMAYPRTYHTLTLLPDGNVLATGGSQTNDPGSQPVYAAEIWDAQTETWSTMSSGQMARTYHETALLLPDGRILVAGSGGCCGAPDQFNAEIFSPPYLFQGPRPTISSAPTTIGYGTQFVVGTQDATSIGSVTLMRLSAVTHQFDRSQNYVPLSITPVANGFSVQMPLNPNLAPPGDYMLFIVNTSGVPSVAAMVKVQ